MGCVPVCSLGRMIWALRTQMVRRQEGERTERTPSPARQAEGLGFRAPGITVRGEGAPTPPSPQQGAWRLGGGVWASCGVERSVTGSSSACPGVRTLTAGHQRQDQPGLWACDRVTVQTTQSRDEHPHSSRTVCPQLHFCSPDSWVSPHPAPRTSHVPRRPQAEVPGWGGPQFSTGHFLS